MVLLTRREERPRFGRAVVLGIVLLALAFSQIVVFCTFSAAVAASDCVFEGRIRPRRMAAMLATLGVVLGLARLGGGFFLPSLQPGGQLVWHLGVTDSVAGTLEWMLRSYGLLLPLGIAGLFLLRRERLVLALLILGSLVVLNTVKHRSSWDVAKFATIATLGLGIAASAVVVRLFQLRRELGRRTARGFGVLAVFCALGTTVGGLAFHAAIWMDLPGARYEGHPVYLGEDDVRVVEFLRRAMGPRELVYRAKKESYGYNQWAGLNVGWPEYPSKHFGFGDRIAPRLDLLQRRPSDPKLWRHDGFRWLVVPTTDRRLTALSQAWIAQGQARVAFEHGALSVVQLLGP